MKETLLGEVLVAAGRIHPSELRVALNHQKANGGRLGHALLQLGICDETALIRGLASQQGLDFIDIDRWPIQDEAVRLVPMKLLKNYSVFPLMIVNEELLVATVPPPDPRALDYLASITELEIRPVVATMSGIQRTIARVEWEQAQADRWAENNELFVEY